MPVQFDLFGGRKKLEKTFDEEYKEYIGSSAWKRIRDAKIESVGGKCEKCGTSKWSARLEVHHLHYRNFKHERLEDLQVLCFPVCHESADHEREIEAIEARKTKAVYKGFETWMDNGNNGDWRSWNNSKMEQAWKRFLDYLANTTRRPRYDIPFWRNPEW